MVHCFFFFFRSRLSWWDCLPTSRRLATVRMLFLFESYERVPYCERANLTDGSSQRMLQQPTFTSSSTCGTYSQFIQEIYAELRGTSLRRFNPLSVCFTLDGNTTLRSSCSRIVLQIIIGLNCSFLRCVGSSAQVQMSCHVFLLCSGNQTFELSQAVQLEFYLASHLCTLQVHRNVNCCTSALFIL